MVPTKYSRDSIIDTVGFSHEEILTHLDDVLASPPFKSSQRSQQFLRYVVGHTLDGQGDHLKERMIGEEIFGRPADYDTGQDSIVRVKANEVRRRLSQYYEQHPNPPIRIEMPAGCYAVHFRAGQAVTPVSEPVALAVEPVRLSRRFPYAVVAGVAIAALAIWRFWPAPVPALFEQFWQPFLAAREVIICLPTPDTFRIYGTDRDALAAALKPRAPGGALPLVPPSILDDVKIVPEPGMFVGLGDARALMLLHSFFVSRSQTPTVRLGDSTTFTDLRAKPAVLIGGFTNPWSLDLSREHRFLLARSGTSMGIRDNSTGKFLCQKPPSWAPRGTEDCAVITRLHESKTGHALLIAAGLDHFGTFAVGEFLTSPKRLETALKQADPAWESKNLQIVFRIERVHDDVGPPTILAVHTW